MAGPSLAVTMGEPGGVGGELTVKAWRALAGGETTFFVIDDPARLERLGADIALIASPAAAAGVFASRLPVLDIGAAVDAEAGRAEPENATLVIASIEKAVRLALSGDAGGVVTNPIQKSVLIAAGFPFPGHTEFLGALTKDAPMPGARRRGPVMMLSGRDLRTVPVTVHLPLAKAAATLTSEAIIDAGLVTAESLAHDFAIARPRLAVAGLNPHAGEAGALGAEDEAIVAPAVAALRRAGVEARGPLPADTMFHESARASYDAALCMYHDQALIPIKTIAFHDAVNVTLGLPIVRTSPDHGTALDIAGTGAARPDSLVAAIKLAAEMAARRTDASR